ncbi:uncharacterized protein ARMOST_19595 [Armillaria ostoyae]|uniref:Uncharacterized protein n=1 Tax=Armillaria ostoyae TaxID=47428 RepID=A0A284S4Z6_ARMOS|nr:uncharacterized protein ARMOST_19595 [Armillaria ostoyae]
MLKTRPLSKPNQLVMAAVELDDVFYFFSSPPNASSRLSCVDVESGMARAWRGRNGGKVSQSRGSNSAFTITSNIFLSLTLTVYRGQALQVHHHLARLPKHTQYLPIERNSMFPNYRRPLDLSSIHDLAKPSTYVPTKAKSGTIQVE